MKFEYTEETKNYKPVTNAWYEAKIEEVTDNSKDWNEIIVRFRIDDGNLYEYGGVIINKYNLEYEGAKKALVALYRSAMNNPNATKIDTEELVGKKVQIKVEIKESNGKIFKNIVATNPSDKIQEPTEESPKNTEELPFD